MRIALPILLCTLAVCGVTVAAQAPPAKADIVSVAGCLREQPAGEWRVVNATEPTLSTANAPRAADLPKLPVVGKNQYRLIGVAIFDLPTMRDHTVVVKGLLIKASPVSRLNVTSIVSVATACTAAK